MYLPENAVNKNNIAYICQQIDFFMEGRVDDGCESKVLRYSHLWINHMAINLFI